MCRKELSSSSINKFWTERINSSPFRSARDLNPPILLSRPLGKFIASLRSETFQVEAIIVDCVELDRPAEIRGENEMPSIRRPRGGFVARIALC